MGGKKKEREKVIFAMYENIRNWQERRGEERRGEERRKGRYESYTD
jgi:hypothetical protein